MIMFCMNCVSAGECGGKVARVVDGNVRVGWPGAPGWTITGVSCAQTGSAKHVNIAAVKSPLRKNASLFPTQKYSITSGLTSFVNRGAEEFFFG